MSARKIPYSVKFAATLASIVVLLVTCQQPGQAQTYGSTAKTISFQDTTNFNGTNNTGLIPATGGPIPIVVSGFSGTVSTISVTLHHLNDTYVALDGTSAFSLSEYLLVSPDGRAFSFLAEPCVTYPGSGNAPVTAGTDITFADGGSNKMQFVPAQNAYDCHSVNSSPYAAAYNDNREDFSLKGHFGVPAGATWTTAALTSYKVPTGLTAIGVDTFTSVFQGMGPSAVNGTWYLYPMIFVLGTTSSYSLIGDGTNPAFSITITTSSATATTTALTSSSAACPSGLVGVCETITPPATATGNVTFTATVSPNPGGGTVTFQDISNSAAPTNLACSGSNPANVNGSGVATCVTTFNRQGAHLIQASFNGTSSFGPSSATVEDTVLAATTNPTTGKYCNSGTINFPQVQTSNGLDPAADYPIVINVSGLSGKLIQSMTMSWTQTSFDVTETALLLSSPANNKALHLWEYAGGGGSNGTRNFVLDDNATTHPNPGGGPIASGTYLPTVNVLFGGRYDFCDTTPICNTAAVSGVAPLTFDDAAPKGIGSLLGTFGGLDPNDAWQLFVIQRGQDTGTISNVCLNFTFSSGTGTHSTLQTSGTKITTGANMTLTATVTSGGSSIGANGTVTFQSDGINIPSGANIAVNSSGQAVLVTNQLTEGTHNISARFNGTASLGISSTNLIVVRVDNAATVTNNCGPTGSCVVQYCNKPASGPAISFTQLGPVPYPVVYPSNVIVSNLPGTVADVSVFFKNYMSPSGGQGVQNLLVGPNGNNLDFFSRYAVTCPVNGNGSAPLTGVDLTFADSGSVLVQNPLLSGGLCPLAAISQGTYQPQSVGGNDVYPQCPNNVACTTPTALGPPAPGTPYSYAAPAGTSTFDGQFASNGTQQVLGAGTWSLFATSDFGNPGINVDQWCVNFTENRPTVTITIPSSSTVTQGQTGTTYAVTVHNNSANGGPTGGQLTVASVLPAGMTPNGSGAGTGTDPSWSCSVSSQTITCNNNTSVSVGNDYPALFLAADISQTASTSSPLSLQATATGGGALGTPAATSNTDSITVLPHPTLAITKSHTGNFTQGQTDDWTLTVSNTAAAASSTLGNTITVSDTLPTNYTVSGSGTGWNCSTSGTPVTITCTYTTAITGGNSAPAITLSADVPLTSPTSISNTAYVYGGGDFNHPNLAGAAASAADSVTVIQVPASINVTGGNSQSTAVNTAFATSLQATVLDAASVGIPNYSVVFTAPSGSNIPSAAFSNSTNTITLTTNASGVASASVSANGIAGTSGSGTYTVSAAISPAVTGVNPVSFSLTNTDAPATVTSVSSTAANGTYGLNASIPITVTFNKAVTVTGTPRLQLNSGGSVFATYSSGSGTSTLTFAYTVAAGQSANPLDANATTALTLNGGTMIDSALATAALTLPVGATSGSLAQNKAIVVDTVQPHVSSVSSTAANGTYVLGASIPITVTFSKPVAVTGSPTLALNDGGTATYSSGSGTATLTFAYTAGSNEHTTHLDLASTSALALNGGTITDLDISPNTAVLTVPVAASAGSLATDTSIVILLTTSTGVTSSINASVFGQSVTFTATVTAVSGTGTPTGTVTFLDGGSPIGTGTLSGGLATFTTSALAVGSHTITASYGGDPTFDSSTGSLTGNPQVVNKASTTTAVTSSVNASVFGQSVTFTATVSPVALGAGTPTGTVTFLDGSNPISTGTLSGGVATFTTSALTLGSHTITTSYSGDGNFNSNTGSLTGNPQVVNKASTTTAVASSQNSSAVGQSVTFTATLSVTAPGTGTPTGTITFLDGGSTIGTGTLSGGVATFTTSALVAGNRTITTSYAGDANFNGNTGSLTGNPQVVVAPPAIAQAFNPINIGVGATTLLTFTITNPAANTVAETGVTFTDTLPTGLVVATPNGLSNTCSGTATAVAGSASISLTGGSIAVNSSCTVVMSVTGTASGQYTNTSSAVSSTNGGSGNTASTSLTVATPPTITEVFGVGQIPLNGTTSLTFTIHNPNSSVPLSGIAFTDNLPAGVLVDAPNGLTNTCGGTATAAAGSSSISLSGSTLAASASCTVSVNVQGTSAGVKNNSAQITSIEGGTGNTSNASITVVGPPLIIKAFGAASIPLGGSTSLQFTIQNNNTTVSLSGIGFSDTLPVGLVISTPNGLSGSCGGGTITATQATNVITLSGATLAQSTSCIFSVNVTGTAAGTQNNTTNQVISTEGGTGGTASATTTVVAPPTANVDINPSLVPPNTQGPLLLIGISNPAANAVALTGVAFTITLPTGVVVATPNGLNNTCGGTATAVAGSTSISLAGGSIAANATCSFYLNLIGTTVGSYNIGVTGAGTVTSTNGGTGVASNTYTLNIANPPTISKAFGAASIPLNGSTSLTFTITNPAGNPVSLSNLSFTDALPAGLAVATPSGLSGSCGGGTITAVANSNSVSMSGATLAPSASCTFSMNVTGTAAGVENNTTGPLSSNLVLTPGLTSNTATVTVVAPPVIIKAFGAASIPLNGSTSLQFTIQNNNTTASLSGIGFTDSLPAGLVVSTPNGLTGSCGGGAISATAGSSSISLTGATIAVSSTCTFSVNVTGNTAGAKNNTTSQVTSNEGGTGGTASASLSVVTPPVIAKAFSPTVIFPTAPSTLTFTITNPAANTVAEAGVAFTDTFPANLVVATPNGLTNTCGGTATAVTGSGSVSLTGGTIAAGSSCTVSVSVTSTTPGNYNNVCGAVSSTNGGTGNTASASLSVAHATLSITKTHSGNFTRNESGAFTITVSNAASAGPTDGTTVTVTDILPNVTNTFVPTALSGTGWTCNLGTVTCTRSDALQPGNSYPAITLTVNVPINIQANVTNTATVSGGGDPNTHTATDPTHMGPPLNITLTQTGLSVYDGQSGSLTFQLDTVPNPGPITLSCEGLPLGASCGFSPGTITQTTTIITLAISTQGRIQTSRNRDGRGSIYAMVAMPAFGIGLAVIVLGGKRSKKAKFRLLGMLGGLVLLLSFAGCGGSGGGTYGTPAGSYPITIKASSAGGDATASVTLNVLRYLKGNELGN